MSSTAPDSPDLAMLWLARPNVKPPADAKTALPVEWLYAGLIICPTWHVEIDRSWFEVEFVERNPTSPDLTEGAVVLDMVDGVFRRRRWFATVTFRERRMRMGDMIPTFEAVLYPSRTTGEWSSSLESAS